MPGGARNRQGCALTFVKKSSLNELFFESRTGDLPIVGLVTNVKKLEATTIEIGYGRTNNTRAAEVLPTPAKSPSILSRAWARMKSWFETPYGYEDKNGFHYGRDPLPTRASVSPKEFHKVFTDRTHDTAMFMASTSKLTAPATQPEAAPRKKPASLVNAS